MYYIFVIAFFLSLPITAMESVTAHDYDLYVAVQKIRSQLIGLIKEKSDRFKKSTFVDNDCLINEQTKTGLILSIIKQTHSGQTSTSYSIITPWGGIGLIYGTDTILEYLASELSLMKLGKLKKNPVCKPIGTGNTIATIRLNYALVACDTHNLPPAKVNKLAPLKYADALIQYSSHKERYRQEQLAKMSQENK